jgi:hypothetical protein
MPESDKDDTSMVKSPYPLIFISHDSRDAELAEAFSKLLSSVSAGMLKSFRSSDRKGSQGIEYGVEWYPELKSKLESASDVVCLWTQRSIDRPWLLYEAGFAKGRLNTPVYGVALGISLSLVNTGPFAQFQNCDDNEESLTKLIMQLVRRIPGAEPDHDAIQMQVKIFKERTTKALEPITEAKPLKGGATEVGDASEGKLFPISQLPGALIPGTPSPFHGTTQPQEALDSDDLKIVRYYIVFTKRGLEHVFPEMAELVDYATTGEAFKSTKVAEFIQNLPNIPIPQKWVWQGYPRQVSSGDMMQCVQYLPEDDLRYVHCIYHVDGRLPIDRASRTHEV